MKTWLGVELQKKNKVGSEGRRLTKEKRFEKKRRKGKKEEKGSWEKRKRSLIKAKSEKKLKEDDLKQETRE